MKDKLEPYIHADMMKPHGEHVIFFRENGFSHPMQLSGHKSTAEECNDFAICNPGTIRIETLAGEVLWPEGTKH